jgi:hypothetical protein|nr:MAG TPA: hypothetical protein [Caudoviricetes sp.]
MIDDKKIEAAKEEIYEDRFLLNGEEVVFDNDAKEEMFYKEDIKEAIGLGAKWAINEFLKNLWHPASEKPLLRSGKCLVVYNGGTIGIFKISFVYEMLSNYGKNGMGWKYWCYVSDLFPKQGGE